MQPRHAHTLNNFDLLRIAAALQVLLGHGMLHLEIEPPVWWPIVSAFPGVPIFFVISGYLISTSYERSASVVAYARNRALRIYPALWLCLLLTIAVASAAGYGFLSTEALAWLPAQMAGLAYTPAFLKSFGFGSYNGSLWTIPIELQFYLVLPLLYALLGRRSPAFDKRLATLLALFIVLALAFELSWTGDVRGADEPTLHKLMRYTFAPHIYLFLAGVLLQRLQMARSAWVAGKGLHWLAVYLAFHFAMPGNPWTDIGGNLLLSIGVVAVAFSRPGLSQRILRGNDVSYGVYIYHGLLINVFLTLGWRGHDELIALLLVATLVLSLASWKLVEQPCLRRKGRGTPRPPRVVDVMAVEPDASR